MSMCVDLNKNENRCLYRSINITFTELEFMIIKHNSV